MATVNNLTKFSIAHTMLMINKLLHTRHYPLHMHSIVYCKLSASKFMNLKKCKVTLFFFGQPKNTKTKEECERYRCRRAGESESTFFLFLFTCVQYQKSVDQKIIVCGPHLYFRSNNYLLLCNAYIYMRKYKNMVQQQQQQQKTLHEIRYCC